MTNWAAVAELVEAWTEGVAICGDEVAVARKVDGVLHIESAVTRDGVRAKDVRG